MKRWAVGVFNMMDNMLTVEIIASDTWHGAVTKHSAVGGIEFDVSDIEQAKQDFFDCDMGLDVVQITD